MTQPTTYRVEFTGWREYDDCWRTVMALSAAEFYLARIPENNLPARIVEMPGEKVLQERRRPTDYNHIFRTFLGIPPTKGDKPLCGADLPDSWDFPGHDRPPCPTCQQLANQDRSNP